MKRDVFGRRDSAREIIHGIIVNGPELAVDDAEVFMELGRGSCYSVDLITEEDVPSAYWILAKWML